LEAYICHQWRKSLSFSAVNGTGKIAEDWVQALEILTFCQGLKMLTLLPWSNVLSRQFLIRRLRAWCSYCYEEWHKEKGVIFEPLLWVFNAIKVCPRHKVVLETICPYCKRPQGFLNGKSRVGYCSLCQKWLGRKSKENIASEILEDLAYEVWVAESVSEIIAASPQLQVAPAKERVLETILWGIEQLTGGNASKFAKLINACHGISYSWRNRKKLPNFSTVLRICKLLNIQPINFLTDYQH
jgi:hypothetical protein